ncbi:hypothetical protein [Nocardia sp. alder85J]|uniref:hypothetical protein n=1 Tax=Nocardia sp. alder85J TaxID=2862949 RepID=UPI001CD1B110|nr:hypothetical protein [Nocardia sp. alder85J]MCX4096391.1 hypothetical protein [Nocardia sp. alder85J]
MTIHHLNCGSVRRIEATYPGREPAAAVNRWLLHCGDAYYHHRELDDEPHPHPILDMVQTGFEVHRDLRLGTQARLRELVHRHGDEVTLISAHDPWEWQRLRRESAPA